MIPEVGSVAIQTWGAIAVLILMLVVFITERLPADVTAIGVVLLLMLGGYITPQEAFEGFSSPVVVVMVCTLFVATALRSTGVGDAAARWIQRYAGSDERRAIAVVMIVSAVLSGFMSNVAAAALLMPAVAVLSHESGIAPSRLFIPLAFAVSLGGMLTLIGAPANILAAELLVRAGLGPVSFFYFTPYAVAALAVGVLFMATYGRRLLPLRKTQRRTRRISDLRALARLQERLFSVRVPEQAPCAGRTLSELRFGSLIGGAVITIIRGGRKVLSPRAHEQIQPRDVLLVRGNPERFGEIQALQGLRIEPASGELLRGLVQSADIVRFSIREVHTDTRLLSLREVLRSTGLIPLVIDRPADTHAWETHPPAWFLDSLVHKGDAVIGSPVVRFSEDSPLIDMDIEEVPRPYEVLAEGLFTVEIEAGGWSGAPLHRLAQETKLAILGLIAPGRGIEWLDVPVRSPNGESAPPRLSADHVLREGERYVVSGGAREAAHKGLLSGLSLEAQADPATSEVAEVGMVELILTPRSEFIGRTLADLHLREKYECQVVALWRDGRPHLSVSSSLPLLFGDSLLVQGPLASMSVLAKDPDFLLLSEHRRTPALSMRSVFSMVALLLLVFMPMLSAVPVHQVAFFSACIVIFSGAVTMEQVYREIDWRVVFLLALLIPLGHVVERVAVSEGMVAVLHNLDAVLPTAALAAVFLLLSSALGQILDSAIAVIFLGPFALALGAHSPQSAQLLLLAVTLGSSFSFVLSTSCRSNVLVTGAGGYRTADFVRVGVPFTIVVGAVVVAVLSLRFLA